MQVVAEDIQTGLPRLIGGLTAFVLLNGLAWPSEMFGKLVILTAVVPLFVATSGFPPLIDLAESSLRRGVVYLCGIGFAGSLVFGSWGYVAFIARGDSGDAFFGLTMFLGAVLALGFTLVGLLALLPPLATHLRDDRISRGPWLGLALLPIGWGIGSIGGGDPWPWFLVGLVAFVAIVVWALSLAYARARTPSGTRAAPDPEA